MPYVALLCEDELLRGRCPPRVPAAKRQERRDDAANWKRKRKRRQQTKGGKAAREVPADGDVENSEPFPWTCSLRRVATASLYSCI